eukprot:PLAT3359.18.p2 GENE.PLAT3359.18~~PLAT3359.18.p2  ORF type:complete len:327 (-),score=150.08 PLAT3359.18:137-1117(-)
MGGSSLDAKTMRGLGAAVLYGSISISITFFNKAVLSLFDFHFSNVMTLYQMTLSLFFLQVAKYMGLISFKDFRPELVKEVYPLSFCFLGMVVTGLGALRYLNVPMFNALRRVTTLVTMAMEYFMQGKTSSRETLMAVVVMVFGAIFAGATDLTFHAWGYILVQLNCLVTAGYLVYINRMTRTDALNKFGLMFYNNLLSWPVVAVLVYASGEWEELQSYEYLSDRNFQICLFISSAQAFFLNYAIFLCTSLNSALTTSVTGQIKNIVTTGVGLFIFGDVILTFSNFTGLLIGVVGSAWYSWLKYAESEARKKKQADGTAMTTPADKA